MYADDPELGEGGAGLGFSGLDSIMAIEFDTFYNYEVDRDGGLGTLAENHVAVFANLHGDIVVNDHRKQLAGREVDDVRIYCRPHPTSVERANAPHQEYSFQEQRKGSHREKSQEPRVVGTRALGRV